MKLYEFCSKEEYVSSLSDELASLIEKIINTKSSVTIAVSGGKSPIPLFEALSHKKISWSKVTITLVDERFVPTDNPDSNEHLVRNHLLINEASDAYFIGLTTTDNILSSVNNANLNIKDIDIAILGMGEDGHTSSIFPDCKELETVIDTAITPEKYVITTPQAASHQRVGLSLSGILSIPHLFLSINGDNKLNVMKKALEINNLTYPISYVLNERQDIKIFWHV